MADKKHYTQQQFARLSPKSENNPHYTLQVRGYDGSHTNWMTLYAPQLKVLEQMIGACDDENPDAPAYTPGAQWRAAGEADPHGDRYDCERAKLCMGHLSDDELANGAYLNYDRPLDINAILNKQPGYASPIAWMEAVKDRIRWLSRKLEEATREKAQ